MNIIELLMRECNNYFYKWKEKGTFTIRENKITGFKGKYLKGQYILLKGSVLNDGVYLIENTTGTELTVTGLSDEVYEGIMYGLAVPKSFLSLAEEIKDYLVNKPKDRNLVSESFNNYSKSYATGNGGKVLEWQIIFSDSIGEYRQAFDGERWVKSL